MAAKVKKDSDVKSVYERYEQGLVHLYEGEYASALQKFGQIEKERADDLELLARVRMLSKVCTDRLEQKSKGNHKPITADDFYNLAVFSHNRGQYEVAVENFRKALEIAGKDLHYVHYGIAASKALQNKTDEALHHLKVAIELKPDSRFIVANDPDFEDFEDISEFRTLLGSGG